mmetsp:Transcript_25053/g.81003  ORF Transcript_25053/g.81003 Transcript_25053/m.81003 type:complete len:223 (-) Transcript_25053:893-1561(-)
MPTLVATSSSARPTAVPIISQAWPGTALDCSISRPGQPATVPNLPPAMFSIPLFLARRDSQPSLARPVNTDSSVPRISLSSASAFWTTAGGALPAKPGEESRAASFSMSASSLACCLPSLARSLSASTRAAKGRSASRPSCTTMRAAAPPMLFSAAAAAAARSAAGVMMSDDGSMRARVAMACASVSSAGAMACDASTVAAIFLAGLTLYSALALRTERTSA